MIIMICVTSNNNLFVANDEILSADATKIISDYTLLKAIHYYLHIFTINPIWIKMRTIIIPFTSSIFSPDFMIDKKWEKPCGVFPFSFFFGEAIFSSQY